jgi:putative ABC transport system permease protein
LQTLVRRLQQEYPETNANMGASLASLHSFINGDARRPLLVLLGSVGLLLLIACANVGNLLLVQAIGKQRELSLRLALGAGHSRLVRQALTESLTLSLLGGVGGLVVGWMGVRALAGTQSAELLPMQQFGIDWRVLAFLLLVTTVSALLFGIAPSVWGQRQLPANALREGTRSSGDGVRMRGWGNALAVGEVALALLLTVGAGLLVRSYAALRRVDPGFQSSGVLTLSLEMPGGRYDSAAVLTQFDRAWLERVRATPGVSSASLVSALPLTGTGWTSDFAVRGRGRDDFATEVRHREVAGDYFGTMHVPLLRGRSFTDADANSTELVVVVNDALVRKYFRGSDPLGQQITFARVPDSTSRWRTIVGVVGSERQKGMQIEPQDEIFAPMAQEQQRAIVLVVRTAGDPLSLAPAMRRALRETDPNLAIESVQTMNDVLDTSLARDRFLMTMLLVFASVGLVLAIVGVYGVLAQTARRRTREMGVRIALGARAAQLRWLVIAHGLKLVAAGLLIGAMLALVMTRAMQRVLFDVPPSDPATYVIVALVLGRRELRRRGCRRTARAGRIRRWCCGRSDGRCLRAGRGDVNAWIFVRRRWTARATASILRNALGKCMPFLIEQKNRSSDSLVVLSGVAALLDTVIGAMINLGLDLSRTYELVFGISLVLGFPMYLLDLWLKKRYAFFLLFLFLFRWAIRCFGGPTPALGNPIDWPVGILLFTALVLLQWSKLRTTPA